MCVTSLEAHVWFSISCFRTCDTATLIVKISTSTTKSRVLNSKVCLDSHAATRYPIIAEPASILIPGLQRDSRESVVRCVLARLNLWRLQDLTLLPHSKSGNLSFLPPSNLRSQRLSRMTRNILTISGPIKRPGHMYAP